MASIEGTNSMKQIVLQIPTFLNVYNDGSTERLGNMPRAPPCLNDPETGVSSKDIVFSINPLLSARLYLPKLNANDQKVPILVYFHGGGFCRESAFSEHHHEYCNIVASQANVLIVSVEHRKAPEHYLPAAYEDCWAGLKWAATHAKATQNSHIISEPWLIDHGDFSKIFIGGDSSGGNIVHNVAMRAGVEPLPNGVKIIGAYMNHPYFCGSKPVGSEPIEGFEKSLPYMAWGIVYPDAPGGIDNPMVNPMAPGAPSLATLGCSKMFISVAGDDVSFRDRTVLYYEAVRASGWKGQVQLFEEKGEQHVYYMFHPHTDKGKRLIKHVTDFLRQ
ncbi:hypothetical protein HN51_069126 [Arachis hypogaea]|uniref:Alpha/beta hydrolase fold-3 domain-containing protein n=3 Tax=Arachis hypogaea TaxID=3818 RepID=A0A444Z7I7_ARAHY|nr:2-hydroxyisoflavanone dehydratase-like [Arachis ipaensis]XP_025654099.1 2-hydroxyisoflavanone dehydratase [Arachis hypogaea]QHO11338.1 2-hydroxyisoflavanone dehydratase [Arachis hypogaea]RYR10131.1 hypothetical protein Ahy_B05g078601 isoform A [Arachis hypogaea]